MKQLIFAFSFAILSSACTQESSTGLEDWKYIAIDSTKQKWGDWQDPEWLRYFGLDAGDVDHDGDLDILSGRYVYHNPGDDMSAPWPRTVLDDNVDGILILDVDGDVYADIIAQALPNIYWYEAQNQEGTLYQRRLVANVPATGHVNSQGFERAQIVSGGKEEILIAGNGDIYCIPIPNDPMSPWEPLLIGRNTSDEGIGVGDIDGDGDMDIACGRRPDGEDEPKILIWFENPGELRPGWNVRHIGKSIHPLDRVMIAKIDNDSLADIVITEERYPGLEPDGHIYWFKNPGMNKGEWTQSVITTQYSINNLDIADMDDDGDLDLVTNEHKGPKLELQLWYNDGSGNFSKEVIDTGKENHLGTQLADLDGDGDLDIYGSAWDNHQWMHVWRNEAIASSTSRQSIKEFTWTPSMVSDDGKFLRVGGKLDYAINPDHFPPSAHKDGWITLSKNIDLDQAVSAELIVERVQSHGGTTGLQVCLDGERWHSVPNPSRIPGDARNYMFHHNARIPIDLSELNSDSIRFKFKVDSIHPWNWSQNLVYGVVLQIRYAKTMQALPTVTLESGKDLTDQVILQLDQANDPLIKKVDYLGFYEDADLSGDGIFSRWQYYYHRGELAGHIGSSTTAPFRVKWDTRWIPDQQAPIRIKARLTFADGTIIWTEEISDLELSRSYAVKLIKPFGVPENWVTRESDFTEMLQIDADEKPIDALLIWRSWSPCYDTGILINNKKVEMQKGEWPCYDYALHQQKIAPELLRNGLNTLTTLKTPLYNGQMVHGMEVQWPGIMLKVKYADKQAQSIIFEGSYEEREHFVIKTASATYYLDKKGGGFSRVLDTDGNDWISFKKEPWGEYPASAASAFRGLPNLVHRGDESGAGHPGFDECKSEVISDREILVTSHSGKWQWKYTFHHDHVLLDILKTDAARAYWFLYEGTPGGKFSPDKSYFGTSAGGPYSKLPDFFLDKPDFGNYQWFYAGDTTTDRVFYAAQVNADNTTDLVSFLGNEKAGLGSPDGMTVFGFGRNEETEPLLTGNHQFVLGFYPSRISTKADHEDMSSYINTLINKSE